jgi:hypothetical protein
LSNSGVAFCYFQLLDSFPKRGHSRIEAWLGRLPYSCTGYWRALQRAGDIVTDEMEQASSKIAGLALKNDSKVIPAVASH